MNNFFYTISFVTVFLGFFLLLYIGYMLLYPFKPVILHKSPFEVNKTVYKAGEQLEYKLVYTKTMPIAPRIKYFIVGTIVYPLSQRGVSRPIGTRTTRLQTQIPPELPSGKYILQIDLEYDISPLRTIYYSWQSVEFEVIEQREVDKK